MDSITKEKQIKNLLYNIKSQYILISILEILAQKQKFKLFNYNKNIQQILKIDINMYKHLYNQIEIEIFPISIKKENEFINIRDDYKAPYHFYFNDEKKETMRTFFTDEENIKKIKIIIDPKYDSLERLFERINCIEKINFIKFNKTDIRDMSHLFEGCSVKEINFFKFKTDNVLYMSDMFCGCDQLEKLDLSKFNTSKVKIMSNMFNSCKSLRKLDLHNFNTEKVIYMNDMLRDCINLRELDISNFSSKNLYSAEFMFSNSYRLVDIKVNENFYIDCKKRTGVTFNCNEYTQNIFKDKIRNENDNDDSICFLI